MTPEEKSSLIDGLKAKYPTLYESSPDCDPDTFVIFRPAARTEYTKYRSDRENGSAVDAEFGLSYVTVVYPPRSELDAVFDRYPAFASSLAVDIIHNSGGLKSETRKL